MGAARWPEPPGCHLPTLYAAYALAYRIDAVPAPWSEPRRRAAGPVDVPTPVDRKPATG